MLQNCTKDLEEFLPGSYLGFSARGVPRHRSRNGFWGFRLSSGQRGKIFKVSVILLPAVAFLNRKVNNSNNNNDDDLFYNITSALIVDIATPWGSRMLLIKLQVLRRPQFFFLGGGYLPLGG